MNEKTGTGVSSDKEQVNESPSIHYIDSLAPWTKFGPAIRVGSGWDPGMTYNLYIYTCIYTLFQ